MIFLLLYYTSTSGIEILLTVLRKSYLIYEKNLLLRPIARRLIGNFSCLNKRFIKKMTVWSPLLYFLTSQDY